MFVGHVNGAKQIGGLIGRVEDNPIVIANYAGTDVSGGQALGGSSVNPMPGKHKF